MRSTNFESALDHMAADVVKSNGKSPKDVYFPFAKDAGELDDQIKRKKFHRASHAAIAELKKLKPYKGGNITLRGLHDLDIRKKSTV